ncbi:similar to Saccharomyces cerevisiae YDR530C APA2 Diadenosine 5',5''-P1,P4- tetraphosphate phosphorylase II (AP4A phosphorylase), involved in catabolism of bis(5'-nucleosidyl) tetraphosphates [Maudiozyma barnettii]|uniref:Similar to Saccharomyces cerevisiae YDR530C APA2 Diadenosine 5',5''-P1,P4- tetraphosphate phosphorylase II (AP4A phosphorylase), involved in catabolism of bis(5'-nucleosidyl) tetraphosphates n=1 Tax=Maudiozyma barnettii TaxID=61262 RepID=A0A8H2ZIS5_9SACH|nr:similar to Saccharomyces cerevisiae YDR530C APA2 Diadenosine 5',5''-P1,P4- tetraphosphate phosphorylase II (AP4A phosphorylase), involved in catabolism of bis(5'-nucleosidyl) tetraphosphates [Kazachstania barnettii]CAB4253344.1 similar to Saccharomyces cerevisiae YDR530C APA2 Diadenosine 5',5''-P1,P4- tetraphosphate phosphorylase II (AP4A phosphorylase), involved in catabolism of bis(5'-nucleosidyl) tetraphosphates [Kazachstania barnettii]CAD1780880.1 similar to Saccharomyces cerevisiae YDR530
MISATVSQLVNDKFQEAQKNNNVVFKKLDSKNVKDSKTSMRYSVSLVPSLIEKPEFGQTDASEDPLAASEPELLVLDDLDGSGHLKLVLNKFPIVENHSLLITNEFKDQLSALTPEELMTSYKLITKMDNEDENKRHMVIYNSGPQSGSSQNHKHLQLIELPQKFIPFQDTLTNGKDHFLPSIKDEPLQDNKVSFAHFVLPLPEESEEVTEDLLAMCYFSLLQRTLTFFQDWLNETPDLVKSYNLLLTKQWICLVPRSNIKAKSLNVGFNALGYAGILLIKDQESFDEIIETPTIVDDLLLECGFPSTAGIKPNEYNY